jgi:integrase
LSKNPAAGIRPRKGTGRRVDTIEKVKPFSGRQLRTVLEKAALTKFGGRRHADVMWILRLLAYHGARANEIAQLRKEDVTTIDGVDVLMIHDASDGQSVKNDWSVRNVPLHPECKAFMDYAASAKGPWVFGSMVDYSEGRRAGWIIRHFPEFRRTVCGITDPKIKLHSIRHRYVDAMRDAGVPEDRRHAIVGHAEAGAHGEYGRGPGLQALALEVAKVDPLA